MAKRYARVNFQNRPSVATPLSADILNRVDKGVDDCDNAIESLTGTVNGLVTTVAGKIDKTSIAATDTVNDTTKVLGANVGYALGQEIDALNLSKLSVISTATDPNTAPVGMFYFNGTVNAPSFFTGDKSGIIICAQFQTNANYMVQFAMSFNNDSIGFRRKLGGTWQAWVEK